VTAGVATPHSASTNVEAISLPPTTTTLSDKPPNPSTDLVADLEGFLSEQEDAVYVFRRHGSPLSITNLVSHQD